MTAPSSTRQLGRPPRAFRRVAVRCPFGRPAVTEQEAYDVDGEPFPTTYYLTCRAPRRGRVAPRGGRRRRALERGVANDPDLRASLDRATEEQRAVRRELAAGRTGSDGGASLELGIGGSREPAAAQVPARARRLRARAARLRARRADPRRARAAVAASDAAATGTPATLPAARERRQPSRRPAASGRRASPARGRGRRPRPVPAPARAGRPRRRRAPQARGPDVHARRARRRLRATPTAGRGPRSRRLRAPRGWPATLALVADAAFHLYARGASTTGRERAAAQRRAAGRAAASAASGRSLVVLAGAVLFLLGIALGQALEDKPTPGTRTQVRTLTPLPLAPARETVTVTVTARRSVSVQELPALGRFERRWPTETRPVPGAPRGEPTG